MSQPPNRPSGPQLHLRGAVDLSSLQRPAGTTSAQPAPGGAAPGSVVVNLTEANFQAVLQQSAQVPLVVAFGSASSPASADLLATLERLVTGYGGRLVLAKVDYDASPQLAAAFRVQAVPTVVAVMAGQPVPLFQGAAPEEQISAVLDQILQVAAENGITGTVSGAAGPEDEADAEAEPVSNVPPHLRLAEAALEAGDLDGAVDAFASALKQNPADAAAKAGLARADFLRRVSALDPARVRERAAADPSDLAAQLDAADLELYGGNVADAFNRLVDAVRVTKAEQRDQVRVRLVSLFDVVGADDEAVVKARRLLASALF